MGITFDVYSSYSLLTGMDEAKKKALRFYYFTLCYGMNIFLLSAIFITLSLDAYARGGGGGGGGGFHGGGMGEEGARMDGGEDFRPEGFDGGGEDGFRADGFNGERDNLDDGARNEDALRPDNSEFDAGYDDREDTQVRAEAAAGPDGAAANVNVRTPSGRDYDATVAGPDGYRNGYIWRDNNYMSVNCDPYAPYAAPFGSWEGWSVVTQPEYINYPVYATYPVETAVQVALQNMGLYSGPIDGNAQSCEQAIAQYEQQNGLDPTGTITPQLLQTLGIQATE